MFHRIARHWPVWLVATFAFPIAGLVGRAIAGPIEGVTSGLASGVAAGLVVGSAQVLAAGERDRRVALGWTVATAAGLGLAAGLGAGLQLPLPVVGLVAGTVMGAGQWLAAGAPAGRLVAWPLVVAAAWSIGWTVTTAVGVDPAAGWAVFGVSGALVSQVLTTIGARVLRSPAGLATT